MKQLFLGLVGLLIAAGPANATGILLPKDRGLPPLAVKTQKVTVTVENNVSQTHVEQVFTNHTRGALEAVFVFPLPAGANINEFAMMMNGKRVKGEVLARAKARQIYSDIVRRMKDPGLIEHMGNNLFQASIFPVPANGEQKIEISYSQVLKPDAGLAEYLYPLKTTSQRLQLVGNFSVFVHLKSKVPLKNIYSPTHKVDIVRKSDREAKISFEERGSPLNRDFQLFYSVDEKDIGMNLMAFREKGKDGYFMLMVSPKVELDENEVVPKDVCFVMDTSGSMNGEKIKQARESLAYCVNALNPKDRFNIVRFSTEVDTFAKQLKDADKAQKAAAVEYIKKLEARGGTDINGALETALKMKADNKRPYLVVFMTDGQPTIGQTDDREIIKSVKDTNKAGTRVFVWGVGHDLNALLLDQIARQTEATSQYVRPGENIEVKVSSFFDKVNSPVLSNLKLDLGKAGAEQVYPKKLTDLFKGQQLMVFGRFDKTGHTAIQLTGEVNGKKQSYTYEAAFPEEESEKPFIATLWANRKVGYLLEEIRANGEKQELVDEVVRLAKEFNIVTPYTSYLVMEDEKNIRPVPVDPGPRPIPPPIRPPRPIPLPRPMMERRSQALDKMDFKAEADDEAGESQLPAKAPSGKGGAAWNAARAKKSAEQEKARELAGGFGRKEGKDAVGASIVMEELKQADVATQSLAVKRKWTLRRVGTRTFGYNRGVWVDLKWDPKTADTTKIKYLSNAWFALMDKDPDLKKVLAMGEQVLVVLKSGKAVVIAKDSGKEDLSEKQLKQLFK